MRILEEANQQNATYEIFEPAQSGCAFLAVISARRTLPYVSILTTEKWVLWASNMPSWYCKWTSDQTRYKDSPFLPILDAIFQFFIFCESILMTATGTKNKKHSDSIMDCPDSYKFGLAWKIAQHAPMRNAHGPFRVKGHLALVYVNNIVLFP